MKQLEHDRGEALIQFNSAKIASLLACHFRVCQQCEHAFQLGTTWDNFVPAYCAVGMNLRRTLLGIRSESYGFSTSINSSKGNRCTKPVRNHVPLWKKRANG